MLVTEAEVRARIPQLAGAPDGDTRLRDLIAMAAQLAAQWCAWPQPATGEAPTLESATYTLYVSDEPGGVVVERSGRELWLPVREVSSVTSIHDDSEQTYGSSSLIDSGDYVLMTPGRVRLLPAATHGAWSEVPYDVRVVCVAGFTAGDVPEIVRVALAEIVAQLYHQGAALAASDSPIVRDLALPLRARQLLGYLRTGHGAAAGSAVPA